MPRKARMVVEGGPSVYHVISRTALDGFVLGDVEKDYLFELIKELGAVYFTETLAFCLMDNHFHLVVRMHPDAAYSDEVIGKRFALYYRNDKIKVLMPGQIPALRKKWSSLSEYLREIKQGFSRFYNRSHKRKGFFWSDRFKSVLVEDGETLINCLAYVDLNPVRAGIVDRPEEYRWSSLGYHLQTGNRDGFLSLDFGLASSEGKSQKQQLALYRQYVYEKGSLNTGKGKMIAADVVGEEAGKNYATGAVDDRFRHRTRYFSDSGIIGSKEFVRHYWEMFCREEDNREKRLLPVAGLEGIYSLKRLSENL